MPHVASASSLFRERRPPRERLRTLVHEMARARRDQLLFEYVAMGLLCATAAATVWVVLARFTPLDVAADAGVAGLLVLALVVAFASARWHRPDELEVVIDADIRLGLEQRLSTAWELDVRGVEPALVERLAARAVRAHRLPGSGERVFPLRPGRAGKLVPLVALVLLLVSVAEPYIDRAPAAPTLDPVLVQEGERLREHGLAMQTRARRDGLTRSAGESQKLQNLGSHMQDGLLSRDQALVRLRALTMSLREQTRLAAGETGAAGETPLQPGELQNIAEAGSHNAPQLHELLEKLMAGTLSTQDLEGLAELAMELAGPAISAEELQAALQQLDEGDQEAVRRLLERLSRIDTAAREIEELELADEEVQRVLESLGDEQDADRRRMLGGSRDPRDADEGDRLLVGLGVTGRGDDDTPRSAAYRSAHGYGGGTDAEKPDNTRARRAQQDADTVIRPRSQLREGELRSSEGRVLPRDGSVGVATIALDRQFSTQVEEVLSKEEIPLHQKELVRRYFDSLGAASESGAGGTQ